MRTGILFLLILVGICAIWTGLVLADDEVGILPDTGDGSNLFPPTIMSSPDSSSPPGDINHDSDPSPTETPNGELGEIPVITDPSPTETPNEELGEIPVTTEPSPTETPNEELGETPVMTEPSPTETPNGELGDTPVITDPSLMRTQDEVVTPEANSVMVTLGTVTISATGTELNPSGGTGYLNLGAPGSNYYFIYSTGDYYLGSSFSTSATFGILIAASSVTLDGNGQTISHTGGVSGIGIETISDHSTITNFGGISGFQDGIFSHGDSATISDNTVSGNQFGILSDRSTAVISNNIVSGNTEQGITNLGSSATIRGNTVRSNNNGIVSTGSSATITGNTISSNTNAGLYLDTGSSGQVYDNYFANTNNVGGSPIGSHTWSHTPTPGTNVVGGPNIAGNYWSNPTGTGYSDTHGADARGYTDDSYEVKASSGVYDNHPLVITPTPTSTTSPGGSSSNENFNAFNFNSSQIPLIRITITQVSLEAGASPGMTTNVTIILENTGTITLPTETRVELEPVNDNAQSLGPLQVVYRDGQYTLTLPVILPGKPGSYPYIFNPVQIVRDPVSGKETRIPAGDPVQFIIIVHDDGTVEVTSESRSSHVASP